MPKKDAELSNIKVLEQVKANTAPLNPVSAYNQSLDNNTAASICVDDGPNRLIAAEEAQAGFDAIIAKCGTIGNYDGVHHTYNLTFAIYGVSNGRRLALPPRKIKRASSSNICLNFVFNGKSRWDCAMKTCGEPKEDNGCIVYCRYRRTEIMGSELQALGRYGTALPLGDENAVGGN